MALGKRRREEQAAWVATTHLPVAPGHPFFRKLNALLEEADFDAYVESLCRPYYAKGVGRPGIPPGVFFRMLFVGYFEVLDSQRAIAWRCHDSRSLQAFLGYSVTEEAPDHSSLTVIRKRLPLAVYEQVFTKVLAIAQAKKLLKGKTVAADSTLIEVEAAMKTIVRRDTGDDWEAYIRKLMAEEGIQGGLHDRAGLRRRVGDEIDDRPMAHQGASAPVLRNEAEESMLDLVPLACPRRKVADEQTQAQLVRERWQQYLP